MEEDKTKHKHWMKQINYYYFYKPMHQYSLVYNSSLVARQHRIPWRLNISSIEHAVQEEFGNKHTDHSNHQWEDDDNDDDDDD